MSLVYITGLSGSGKSTVCKELKKKGFEAYDADGEGFNRWCDMATGKVVKGNSIKKIDTEERYKKYSWDTSRKKVEKLSKSVENKLAFLCGVSGNEETVWDLFSKVICLIIDEKTLRNRIKTRTSNDFGKIPLELEMLLEWHKSYPGDYLKQGAVAIDANRSLKMVVDDILKLTSNENS